MPNWGYIAVAVFYNLALAIWIGGIVALGALTAPTLFKRLDSRAQAGEIFGAILRKFSRMRVALLPVVIGAAAAKHFLWETHGGRTQPWILLRWVAISMMAAGVLYETFYLEPAVERTHDALRAETGSGSRERFDRLHKRAETFMKGSLMAAIIALLLN